MSDPLDLLPHILDIKVGQAKLDTRMASIEKAVVGNGQPGLAQKVEGLEAVTNRLWGVGAVVTTIGAGLLSLLEYAFHRQH